MKTPPLKTRTVEINLLDMDVVDKADGEGDRDWIATSQ
jgi:hypothetical protein